MNAPFNGSASYRLMQALATSIFVPVWRMRVHGRRRVPLRGGVVAICNHQSFLDLIFVGMAIPREITYIGRDTLWKSFVFRSLTWPFKLMKLRRGTADLAMIREGIERLKRGEFLLLFPEGTRTRDGRIARFSMGFYLLAARARVPVLPIRIRGSFQAWPRRRPYPLPGGVRIDVFEPFLVSEIPEEQVRIFLEDRVYASDRPRVAPNLDR